MTVLSGAACVVRSLEVWASEWCSVHGYHVDPAGAVSAGKLLFVRPQVGLDFLARSARRALSNHTSSSNPGCCDTERISDRRGPGAYEFLQGCVGVEGVGGGFFCAGGPFGEQPGFGEAAVVGWGNVAGSPGGSAGRQIGSASPTKESNCSSTRTRPAASTSRFSQRSHRKLLRHNAVTNYY